MARRSLSLGNRADGASAVLEFDVIRGCAPVVQPCAVIQPAEPSNLIRIAPAFPPGVLKVSDQIQASGGEIVSLRWVDDAVELRFFGRAGDKVEAPVMTFYPAARFARMTAPIPFDEDEDEEIPVLPDETALAAEAARDAMRASGIVILDDRRG